VKYLSVEIIFSYRQFFYTKLILFFLKFLPEEDEGADGDEGVGEVKSGESD